ncbi:MAG: DUF459 domain-containing protein, partial [Deltaproteobacteria bacterium]|nr:DUF459 domain-containing protein [Deltaproteobacteria bacterium]
MNYKHISFTFLVFFIILIIQSAECSANLWENSKKNNSPAQVTQPQPAVQRVPDQEVIESEKATQKKLASPETSTLPSSSEINSSQKNYQTIDNLARNEPKSKKNRLPAAVTSEKEEQKKEEQEGPQPFSLEQIKARAAAAAAHWTRPSRIAKVIMAGDSMMLGGIGMALETKFKTLSISAQKVGKISTGLTHSKRLNWPVYFKQVMDTERPQLVFISLGANDCMPIIDENRKAHKMFSLSWQEQYGLRIGRLLNSALEINALVVWVGLPVMGKEPYNSQTKILNSVAERTCRAYINCSYFDSTKSLVDSQGRYATYISDDKG